MAANGPVHQIVLDTTTLFAVSHEDHGFVPDEGDARPVFPGDADVTAAVDACEWLNAIDVAEEFARELDDLVEEAEDQVLSALGANATLDTTPARHFDLLSARAEAKSHGPNSTLTLTGLLSSRYSGVQVDEADANGVPIEMREEFLVEVKLDLELKVTTGEVDRGASETEVTNVKD